MQEIFDDLFMEKVELRPELTAEDVAEWDSLMQISIVASVEKTFKVRFQVGEVRLTKNVGEFADLVLKRLGAA
jgi:acyl carrier protein